MDGRAGQVLMLNFMRVTMTPSKVQAMRRFLLVMLLMIPIAAFAQKTKVMLMEIKTEIDTRTNRYVELALKHAEATKADFVVLEMDTYGGVMTDAKEIVDMIMDFKKPIVVYINSDAASAGALISLACDSIYMSPGASIGAATVVSGDGEKAPDKYQSYMRGIMRSTAEENHRDPRIAEGMVDDSFEIPGIKKAGQVITFSTSEAIRNGFCEGQVGSLDEVLKANNIKDYTIDRFELGAADKIIEFFINPFISGILILIIIGGIYFEMQTPGATFPILAAGIALVLYLIPYYLNGLADNWEIIALFIGLVLIAAEVFVIPGFGVAGITGIILTVCSLILIMVNNNAFDFEFVPPASILYAVAAAFGGLLGGICLLFIGGSKIADSKFFKRIALVEVHESRKGYTSSFIKEPMVGKKGIAHTVLRPSGKVMIEGQIYDAFTRSEFIEKGQNIEVVGEDTTSLRVRLLV
jgi:membrane-bound serine protease (ClpP class)